MLINKYKEYYDYIESTKPEILNIQKEILSVNNQVSNISSIDELSDLDKTQQMKPKVEYMESLSLKLQKIIGLMAEHGTKVDAEKDAFISSVLTDKIFNKIEIESLIKTELIKSIS